MRGTAQAWLTHGYGETEIESMCSLTQLQEPYLKLCLFHSLVPLEYFINSRFGGLGWTITKTWNLFELDPQSSLSLLFYNPEQMLLCMRGWRVTENSLPIQRHLFRWKLKERSLISRISRMIEPQNLYPAKIIRAEKAAQLLVVELLVRLLYMGASST